MSESHLPDGWIQAYDPTHRHRIWVDTTANPPRVSWAHPYEDKQFLEEHPDLKARVSEPSDPPSYEATIKRRHSFSGEPSSLRAIRLHNSIPESHADDSNKAQKRGVLGKLKDKAIGTKEEREEHRRAKAERRAQHEEEMRQERMRNLEERAAYMRQHGGYVPYHSSWRWADDQPAGVPSRSGGLAFGGPALLAGLVGGLALGDLLSGGF